MRVLLVSHDFLPRHVAGVEVYTEQLASSLARRGHRVELFTTEHDLSRPHARLRRRRWRGLLVHELVNNLHYGSLRETWDWPPAERALAQVLDELRPDVLHVMHLAHLSLGCLREARRRGLAVLFTLHDFWLQCGRGTRLADDGGRCATIERERCARCMSSLRYSHGATMPAVERVLSGVRTMTGWNLDPALRRGLSFVDARRRPSEPAPGGALGNAAPAALLRELARRQDAVRDQVLPAVDLFLAPSRFLRSRFLERGFPAERLEQLDYGIDLERLRRARPVAAEHVRVGYLGTLAPHKAPHLLLQAWARLPRHLRRRAQLTLHGSPHTHPAYARELRQLASAAGARLAGAAGPDAVPALLARTDLLVVPSVWYENAPLTILEARATGTPLLVSDLGGMAELVQPGVDGWRFEAGEADDLAARLRDLLCDPAQLERVRGTARPVKDIHSHATELEQRYGRAREARACGSSLARAGGPG